MRHAAFAEEAFLAGEGAVDELVDDDERARRQLFTERTARRHRHQVGHAAALQDVDVGAVVDVRWRHPVAAAMARQEHNRKAADLATAHLVRRRAPWAVHTLPAGIVHVDVIDARATDDAEN
jgi:hypothetical protein